ncbi:MAG: hypothetical protein ACW99Q_25995 [Candidatus Kariarchaeaceae archaeon]|jgi:hypothetical protein
MSLPSFQYIQTVEVHSDMVELYQQFIIKLISAQKAMKLEKSWVVYENPFSENEKTRQFIFVRPLNNWSEMDEISKEDSLSSILKEIYGENEAIQLLTVAQRSIKQTTTSVLSKIPNLSYNS